MSVDVLFGPAEHGFQSAAYARTYNYLRSLPSDVAVSAIVGIPRDTFAFENADLFAIDEESALRYRFEAYRAIRRSVDDYDIYQHPYITYPGWNPLLLSDDTVDTPVVLGPCEAGHIVSFDAFHHHVSRLAGVDLPTPLTDITYDVFETSKRVVQPVRESLFSRTLDSADRIVAVNDATRRFYERYTETPIDTVPYGVNLDRFEYAERRETTNVLSVGNLDERKGHEYTIRALPHIRSAVPNAQLDIVGTGYEADHLRQLATDLGVKDAVTLHGHVEESELQKLFRDAQVFVHASLSEGYSHIRLEAMANGCPVVGTRVRGADEMITDGVEGYLVDRRSVDALVEPTVELLQDPERTREMGRNARERIERDHDWADVATAYAEIYRDILDDW